MTPTPKTLASLALTGLLALAAGCTTTALDVRRDQDPGADLRAYKTFAFDGSNFQATTIYFVGDPRTVGASIAVNF